MRTNFYSGGMRPKRAKPVRKWPGQGRTDGEWQTGRIRVAIQHFLGTAKKDKSDPTSGYMSPSRFANLCRRHEELMPDILKTLAPPDRRKIQAMLKPKKAPPKTPPKNP
jgi:hypothetical protein